MRLSGFAPRWRLSTLLAVVAVSAIVLSRWRDRDIPFRAWKRRVFDQSVELGYGIRAAREGLLGRVPGVTKARALDHLRGALSARDAGVRKRAAESLTFSVVDGFSAEPAARELTAALRDADPAVRETVARNLGLIVGDSGPFLDVVLPALVAAALDPRYPSRDHAATGLGFLGRLSPRGRGAAISTLLAMTDEADPEIRRAAVCGLISILKAKSPASAVVDNEYGEFITPDPSVRVAIMPRLLQMRSDPSRLVRSWVFHGIVTSGIPGDAMPGLLDVVSRELADPDPSSASPGEQNIALLTLAHYPARPPEVVATLVAAAGSTEISHRRLAIWALGRTGTPATPELDALLQDAAEDPDASIRKAADATLAHFRARSATPAP